MARLAILAAALGVFAAQTALADWDLDGLDKVTVVSSAGETEQFAAREIVRLLGKAGIAAERKTGGAPGCWLTVGTGTDPSDPADVLHDGYRLECGDAGVAVSASQPKGVLNGAYRLAEDWGFAFIMPGDDGELVPRRLQRLKSGRRTVNPRFKYRGVYFGSTLSGYTREEWYGFLAKLRFNAYCEHHSVTVPPERETLRRLGFRYEAGGHGMSACLPREEFAEHPEKFRMFQPEDFNGRRMPDSNFCVTHPETQATVKRNYLRRIADAPDQGVYAVHAWADDLPAGGWCMCSRCRGLDGADQSALAMNLQARALREAGVKMRVPMLAYHDTMFPATAIRPDPLCFLLFAPRERCFAHAINDPRCARNRQYMAALSAYREYFRGIDDAHTFEYYSDKLLFRGHTPYLPDVILGDADAYEANGIECWMSLQVGGEPVAVDWNMLAHAAVAWERGLDRGALTAKLAAKVAGDGADAWREYLLAKAAGYEKGWQICGYPYSLYFDYRFLPERGDATGLATAENLAAAARLLSGSAEKLAAALDGGHRLGSKWAERERLRTAFEVRDMAAMAPYARAMHAIGRSWNSDDVRDLDEAVGQLTEARDKLAEAYVAHLNLLLPICGKQRMTEANHYYNGFATSFMDKEIARKIELLKQAKAMRGGQSGSGCR